MANPFSRAMAGSRGSCFDMGRPSWYYVPRKTVGARRCRRICPDLRQHAIEQGDLRVTQKRGSEK
jgi:hypothetical protein